ncbi:hypothetical protein DF186_20410, partial [Enterococcus hirae]
PAMAGGDGLQARQVERQQVTAPRVGEGVQFVDDPRAKPLEQPLRLPRRKQQRQLLRRGEQDVGRGGLLALALGLRRVSGACLQR